MACSPRYPRLIMTYLFSFLIIITFALNPTRAALTDTAEVDADGANKPNKRWSFPARWGPPPRVQTRDLVQLPGDYGRGSGTLRKWISRKMAEDERNLGLFDEEGVQWPEKDLVGMTGDEARAAVLAGNSELAPENVYVVPHDGMVTHDIREDRVRIYLGEDGKVAYQPNIG